MWAEFVCTNNKNKNLFIIFEKSFFMEPYTPPSYPIIPAFSLWGLLFIFI